jgi:hypothetical protein
MAIGWLFKVGDEAAERAWKNLAPMCGAEELYQHLGRVVFAIVANAVRKPTSNPRPIWRFGRSALEQRRSVAAMKRVAKDLDELAQSKLGRVLFGEGDDLAQKIQERADLVSHAPKRILKGLRPPGIKEADLLEWALVQFVKEKTGSRNLESVRVLLWASCICGLGEGMQRYAPSFEAAALKKRLERVEEHVRHLRPPKK